MQFFDTHAHLGLIYDDPIEQLRVVHEAKKAQVTRIISICNNLHDFGTVYDNLKSSKNDNNISSRIVVSKQLYSSLSVSLDKNDAA